MICIECNGRGWIPCPCLHNDPQCWDCNGRGQLECEDCDGTGIEDGIILGDTEEE